MKRILTGFTLFLISTSIIMAQPPREGGGPGEPGGPRGQGEFGGRGRGFGGPGGPGGQGGGGVEESVTRMMSLDKDSDGKLSEEELKDTRLSSLMSRADANQDKFVTKEELTQLLTKEAEARGDRPFGEGGPGGPGGPGGRGGRGFGMTRPGIVLPEFLIEQIQATKEQRDALAKLQATVDEELKKILTDEQRQMLAEPPRGPRGGEGRPPEGFEGGRGGRPEGGPGGYGRRPEGDQPPPPPPPRAEGDQPPPPPPPRPE